MKKRKSSPKTRIKNRLWRALILYIRKRDENTCQWCLKKSYGKNAHTSHVLGRAQDGRLKFDPINLKLLCYRCHLVWHESPPISGMWFREHFPERWQYIHSQRKMNKDAGSITVAWYEDQLEYVLDLTEQLRK